MKMYLLYMKMSFQNALKYPNKAFKIFPGLVFLMIGVVLFIVGYTSSVGEFRLDDIALQESMKNIGILYAAGFSSFVGLIYLFTIFAETGLGFRSSDANLLMKAPIHPFSAFVFVFLKQTVLTIGLSFFMIGAQANSIVRLTNNNQVLIISLIVFLLTTYYLQFMSYIIQYFKFKNLLLTRIVAGVFIATFVMLGIYGHYNVEGGIVSFKLIQFFPVLGWNLGIIESFVNQNYVMMSVFFVIYIVTMIFMIYLCPRLDFNYYEYELSKVAKTEKQYRKMIGEGSSDVKLFKKSSATMKRVGPEVLIDYSIITNGRFWFISFKQIFMFIFVLGIPFFIYLSKTSGFETAIMMLISVVAIKLYIGAVGGVNGEFYRNFYLKLLPISTIKKVTYIHYTKIKSLIVEVACLTLSMLVSPLILQIESIPTLDLGVIVFIYFLFGLIEILKEENISGYIFGKVGQVLTLIFNIVETVIKLGVLFGLGLLVFNAAGKYIMYGFVVIYLIVYLALALFISIYIYDHYDMVSFKTEE